MKVSVIVVASLFRQRRFTQTGNTFVSAIYRNDSRVIWVVQPLLEKYFA
jgi:hypothetical protein